MFKHVATIIFFVMILPDYISAMEEKIERYQIWLTSHKLLVEIIWPNQVAHELTTTDLTNKEIVKTLCLLPKYNNNNDACFSIYKGSFEKNKPIKWTITQVHVKEAIKHMLQRGCKKINMTPNTWKKISKLELISHYSNYIFSYSKERKCYFMCPIT